ncbi:MAG TPA: hemerythrin domain-containing protein [Acidimicrobiales bacterium]|jgi:hypothetical protein|nr:hemerythrin domain-containing protein [Acidimicrobiales bacterium]
MSVESLSEEAAWDGIGVLIVHHRRIDHLWQLLDGSEGVLSEARRLGLAQRLIGTLSAHIGVEERYVYPLVRRSAPDGAALADEALEAHHDILRHLAVLDGTQPDEPGFETGFHGVMTQVGRHIRHEEAVVFPALLGAVDRLTLVLLAGRIQRGARLVPTRPHPRLPQSGAVGRVAAPAVGALDRLRDTSRPAPTQEEPAHHTEDRSP